FTCLQIFECLFSCLSDDSGAMRKLSSASVSCKSNICEFFIWHLICVKFDQLTKGGHSLSRQCHDMHGAINGIFLNLYKRSLFNDRMGICSTKSKRADTCNSRLGRAFP